MTSYKQSPRLCKPLTPALSQSPRGRGSQYLFGAQRMAREIRVHQAAGFPQPRAALFRRIRLGEIRFRRRGPSHCPQGFLLWAHRPARPSLVRIFCVRANDAPRTRRRKGPCTITSSGLAVGCVNCARAAARSLEVCWADRRGFPMAVKSGPSPPRVGRNSSRVQPDMTKTGV
jgi:hypothetical protein